VKRLVAAVVLSAWATAGWSAGGGLDLLSTRVNVEDTASLQRGARIYVNYCLGCHSLSFLRYERMGRDLGLSAEQVSDNLLYAADKITAPMSIAMRVDDARKWFGVAPPDLSVISRARGPDWLYSYLTTFYADANPSRPFGVNNVVFEDVGMPHALLPFQGLQTYVRGETPEGATQVHALGLTLDGDDILVRKSATMPDGSHVPVVDRLTVTEPGEMSPGEYRSAMRDLVNFLVYAGEPSQLQRQALGFWVVLFLVMLALILRALYKEYWKDVH
jgi:ubiquinol-cytochrome c reductase cytochrome c1 subunit